MEEGIEWIVVEVMEEVVVVMVDVKEDEGFMDGGDVVVVGGEVMGVDGRVEEVGLVVMC